MAIVSHVTPSCGNFTSSTPITMAHTALKIEL